MPKTGLCVAGLVIFLAACRPALVVPTASPSPIPTVTETSRFPTPSGQFIRATLPPPWTPTFTPSPAPPTATPTRTTTPSPTSTLTAADICAGFQAAVPLKEGARHTMDQTVLITFGAASPDVTVRFLAKLRGSSDQNLGVQMPGGRVYGMEFPLARLPGPGVYDWTLGVHSDRYGDLCSLGGAFTLDAAATAEAADTPEATAAP